MIIGGAWTKRGWETLGQREENSEFHLGLIWKCPYDIFVSF